MVKPIEIAGVHFATREAATKRCQTIHCRDKIGPDIAGDDARVRGGDS